MHTTCATLPKTGSVPIFSIKKGYNSYLQAHEEAEVLESPIGEQEWTRKMLAHKPVTVGQKTFVSRVNPID